jgi:tetratricopeptide (TPR) repeat protein
MIAPTGTALLRTPTAAMDLFEGGKPGRRLVVTFTERHNVDLEGTGFRGRFLLDAGFDVLAVKSRADDWFAGDAAAIEAALGRAMDDAAARYAWRATHGSSMGGYAAIRFARAARADAVFALSPQIDLTRPWDTRWLDRGRAIAGFEAIAARHVRPGCVYTIAYDPHDRDARHAEALFALIPPGAGRRAPAPYAGHPVGPLLRDAGVLDAMTLSALAGDPPPGTRAAIRRVRRESAAYLGALAERCVERRRWRPAASIVGRLLGRRPADAELNCRAAVIADALGQLEAALKHAALAVALAPDHPFMNERLALALLRCGFRPQALRYLDRAIALDPGHAPFREMRARLRAVPGAGAAVDGRRAGGLLEDERSQQEAANGP